MNLQVLSIHMTSSCKSFNNVVDYVKKLEEVKQLGQDQVLATKSCSTSNFNRSYSRSHSQQSYQALLILSTLSPYTISSAGVTSQSSSIRSQRASYSSTSRPSLKRGCYCYGMVGHFKRKFPLRQSGARNNSRLGPQFQQVKVEGRCDLVSWHVRCLRCGKYQV